MHITTTFERLLTFSKTSFVITRIGSGGTRMYDVDVLEPPRRIYPAIPTRPATVNGRLDRE